MTQAGNRSGLSAELQRSRFGFDRVFNPSASQSQVFAEVQPLIQSAIDGYRVCIWTGKWKPRQPVYRPDRRRDGKLTTLAWCDFCLVSSYDQVCIFAYGQTGSGKTFTMMGPDGTSHEARLWVEVRLRCPVEGRGEDHGWMKG